jgi:multiple sugar transport system substrate-binding protein
MKRERYKMMKKLFCGIVISCLCFTGQIFAAKTLQMVEVITSPKRTEVVKERIQEFEAANPGVKVELTSLPWGQAFEKLATMVMAGEAPDVVEMPDTWQAQYVANNMLVDLQPYLNSWSESKQLTKKTMNMATLVGNKPYMLPYGFYLRALFYNKKLFAKAGIANPPETMADFMEAAKKISALGSGTYGYCLRGGVGGTNGWIMMAAIMNGSNEFFDANGKSRINEPDSIKGIQFLLDIYQKGYAPKDSVNWGFNEIVSGFYSGTCAMLDQDPDALISVSDHMDESDFAVTPMPRGKNDLSFPTIGYAGWAIFKSSSHKTDSWKLIEHLSSKPSNLKWAKFVGVLPIHKGADMDPHFSTEQFSGWFKELNDDRYIPTIMPTYLKEWGYFNSSLLKNTSQEALLGQITAKELADQWAKFLNDAYAKWKANQ